MTILGVFLNNEMRTGANRRYLELMEGLAERGAKVFVLMNSRLSYEPRVFTRISAEVPYRRRGFPPASYLFARAAAREYGAIIAAVRASGRARIDWIHVHGDVHFKAADVLKDLSGAKLFFAFRCNDITRGSILRKHRAYAPGEHLLSIILGIKDRLRERRIAQRADLITFQNSSDRDCFTDRVHIDGLGTKTIVIPGHIGPPRFAADTAGANASSSVRTLVYVGAVSLTKGLQTLLKALAVLKERGHGHLRLSVLGKDSDVRVHAMADGLGIGGMVKFEGYVSPFPFLAKSDLMVYPTLYDAYPDTVLEALHVGCPVIASKCGGIPELLQHEELMFEPGAVEEIADRIERCMTDGSFYGRLRELCSGRAEEHRFDWAGRFHEAMEAALGSALPRRNRE